MYFSNINEFKDSGTIGIVGAGRMGKWAINIFNKLDYKNIIYNDLKKDEEIKKATFIESKKELAQKSNWLIICVPISKTVEVINEIGPFVKKDSLFSDFTSIKKEPCKNMAKYSKYAIGIHPMFKETVKNPQGKNIVITPTNKKIQKQKINFLINVFEETGTKVRIMSPKKHDEITSFNQAGIHLILILYGEILKSYCRKNKMDLGDLELLDTPNSKLMNILLGRFLATKNYDVIWGIQNATKEGMKIRESLIKEAEKITSILNKKEREQFISELESVSRKFKKSRLELESQDSDKIVMDLQRFGIEKHFESLYEEIKSIISKEILDICEEMQNARKNKNYGDERGDGIFEKISLICKNTDKNFNEKNIKGTIKELSRLKRFITHTILKGKRRMYPSIRQNSDVFENLSIQTEEIINKLNKLRELQDVVIE